MKKLWYLGLIWVMSLCVGLEAKPADITASDVTTKMQEIMKAHATYKKFTPLLAQRSLSVFIDSLDPGKCYFLESEVAPWNAMSDAELQTVVTQFEMKRFPSYEAVFQVCKKAIERRRLFEEKLDADPLPDDVSAKEFKDLTWAKSDEELYDRLKKLRALQIEVSAKIGNEVKDIALQRLKKRRLKIEDEIVEADQKIAQKTLCTYILKAMASSLDAHTNYFTPSEAEQFLINVQQRLFGIGIQLRDDVDGFTIVKIVEGGPADQEKTLKPKDKIIALNGEPVMGLDVLDVVDLIRGSEGTSIVLRVVRNKGEGKKKDLETFDVRLTRGEVVLKETRVESRAEPFGDGVIVYLRLHSFYQDQETSSVDDLRRAFMEASKDQKVLGVVLDLRYNSGGLLPQAVNVSGLFLKKGVVVSIKDENNEVHHLRDLETQQMWDGPLLVLVNRASASAAEIVAQALQDYGRALLCGDDHTFGKGSFQTFTLNPILGNTVDPQGEYKVTRGRYYTTSGKTPQLKGVQSDIVMPGGLSLLDIGEEHAKYPLDNDSIGASFEDSLADVPLFQRDRIRRLYQHDQQKIMTLYKPYLKQLRHNSQERVKQNKMWHLFLEDVKKSEMDMEEIGSFDRYPDFQLYEGMNIMRDLILLIGNSMQQKAA